MLTRYNYYILAVTVTIFAVRTHFEKMEELVGAVIGLN